MLEQWNSLETFEGNGLRPYHNRAKTAGRFALRYASITGLALSIISLAMVIIC